MGTYREQDPLAALLSREHTRVLECIMQFARDGGAGRTLEARRVLRALAAAETQVLYPAFARVSLRLETQRLLDDCRGSRDDQLAALGELARKRAARLRRLAAVELRSRIEHHAEQHISLLLPVLASQLPRPLYRSIVHAFTARYESDLVHAPRTPVTRSSRRTSGTATASCERYNDE